MKNKVSRTTKLALFLTLCLLFSVPAYSQPIHLSITDYLKTKSITSCVVPDSNVGARVCGRWNPNTPYPNPASANYTQQFIARYGVEPGKGNTTGERYSPTNVEVVARHPSNPLQLTSNRTYNETPSDQWDLLYVFVGGVSGYDHLQGIGRSLGVIAPRPGTFTISGPTTVGVNSTHTYTVPASSSTRGWLWFVTKPGQTRQVISTTNNQLQINFTSLGSYSIDAVGKSSGDEGKLTVVAVGSAPPPPDPPVEPDPEPPPVEPDPDPDPTPPIDPSLLTSCELVELLRVRLSCPR